VLWQEQLEYDSDDSQIDTDTMPTGEDAKKLGCVIKGLWDMRREKLTHDFAKAAFLLSPVEGIRMTAFDMMSPELKFACERLLVKLFMPKHFTDEEANQWKADVLCKFWDEYEEFSNRSGPIFGPSRAHIWASKDITDNRSHLWHKKFSLRDTKWLGKLACRVCSKINGMGNAERCWGAVKHLKDGQRSHLSAKAVTMQATCYGAASAERVELERRYKDTVDNTTWEDADLDDLGLGRYGIDTEALRSESAVNTRVVRCWVEGWENEIRSENDLEAQARFLRKYGGLSFVDGDDAYTIHDRRMYFQKKRGNNRWCVMALTDMYESETEDMSPEEKKELVYTYENFDINDDLFGLLWNHYKKNPDPRFRLVPPPDDGSIAEDGTWNNWIPEADPKTKSK